jgi:hypothetical protein
MTVSDLPILPPYTALSAAGGLGVGVAAGAATATVGNAGSEVGVAVAAGAAASSDEPQAMTVRSPAAIPTAISRLSNVIENIVTPRLMTFAMLHTSNNLMNRAWHTGGDCILKGRIMQVFSSD